MDILSVFLIFSMLAVLWFDTTRYIIPNWLCGLLVLAYAFAAFTTPHAIEWKQALLGMAAVLVVGYVIFMLKFMGAGDIKLMTALALWVGFANLADYLFLVSIIGGVLSLLLWGGRKLLPYLPKKPKKENLPRILQEGAPVPYGIAIALAFLIMMYTGKVPVLS